MDQAVKVLIKWSYFALVHIYYTCAVSLSMYRSQQKEYYVSDPRIARTKLHVLGVLRELLDRDGAEITLSSLATEARVSRRTIYTHWGTVESAVAEAMFDETESAESDRFMLVVTDTLRELPALVRELEQLRREKELAALVA